MLCTNIFALLCLVIEQKQQLHQSENNIKSLVSPMSEDQSDPKVYSDNFDSLNPTQKLNISPVYYEIYGHCKLVQLYTVLKHIRN